MKIVSAEKDVEPQIAAMKGRCDGMPDRKGAVDWDLPMEIYKLMVVPRSKVQFAHRPQLLAPIEEFTKTTHEAIKFVNVCDQCDMPVDTLTATKTMPVVVSMDEEIFSESGKILPPEQKINKVNYTDK